jgi:FkbM family methyltransferase
LAQKYIDYDDIVLELGARYGTVSCAINNKLNKKTNQLVVDPDTRIIDALTKNKINHGCKFNIFNGIITNEKFKLFGEWRNYGVTTVKASENDMNIIPHKTLLELSNEYNLQFNTLFADCEGFLEQFINENIDYIPNFNKIIYEKDYQETCNYENIKNKLLDLGFKIILDDFIDEYTFKGCSYMIFIK